MPVNPEQSNVIGIARQTETKQMHKPGAPSKSRNASSTTKEVAVADGNKFTSLTRVAIPGLLVLEPSSTRNPTAIAMRPTSTAIKIIQSVHAFPKKAAAAVA